MTAHNANNPAHPNHRTIRRSGSRIRAIVATAALVSTLASAASAREPVDFVPADSLACWSGRPFPDTSAADGESSTWQMLLELGSRIASTSGPQLNTGTRLTVRAAEFFNLMIQYPHAVTLIDAQAKPLESDPRARRVDQLRFAAIVKCDKNTEPFLRIIQKTVNEQTNADAATLQNMRTRGWRYQLLRDGRLPQWSTIAWGFIGDFFILTIGEDVWPEIASVAAGDRTSISAEPWFAAARMPNRHEALIEIFVAAGAIQQRLDPFVAGRASAFFKAWDAGALERAHWALGFEGRALFCIAHFRVGDETVKRLYADPKTRTPRLLATIPPEARYAIYDIPTQRMLPRLFRGLIAMQGPEAKANIERIWAEIQAEYEFNVERDLLPNLGNHVVLHNAPPHPLRIPLAMTTLTEIRQHPDRVQKTIEAFCTAWRDKLDEVIERGGAPPFTLRRDDDGVWSMRFGPIAGPAWTVTDRFLITSWSPLALREYLAKVPKAVGVTR